MFVTPNAERAEIDLRKLTGYVLDPGHPEGRNKARVFEAVLGYNQSNATELVRQVRENLGRVPARLGTTDAFGLRYTVDVPVVGPKGSAVVRTGWIVKSGSDIPTLTTMFVKRHERE